MGPLGFRHARVPGERLDFRLPQQGLPHEVVELPRSIFPSAA